MSFWCAFVCVNDFILFAAKEMFFLLFFFLFFFFCFFLFALLFAFIHEKSYGEILDGLRAKEVIAEREKITF